MSLSKRPCRLWAKAKLNPQMKVSGGHPTAQAFGRASLVTRNYFSLWYSGWWKAMGLQDTNSLLIIEQLVLTFSAKTHMPILHTCAEVIFPTQEKLKDMVRWHSPVTPAFGRQRQEAQKFMPTLSYRVDSGPVWATGESVLKRKKER